VALLFAAAATGLAGCGGSGAEVGAMRRGDQAFARGDLAEALAEYRLGLRQGDRTVELLLRAAHAYARSGRIEEARAHYAEAVALDSTVANLAATDLLRVASDAVGRDDGIAAAAAYEGARELRPGVSSSGVALPLARHFARRGQYGQAVPFFEKAVLESGASPEVIYEMAGP
jgi:tetratricopeptide (TPR) repeat protein